MNEKIVEIYDLNLFTMYLKTAIYEFNDERLEYAICEDFIEEKFQKTEWRNCRNTD